MGHAQIPLLIPCVVDQGRLDSFRGRYACDRRDDSTEHASCDISHGREGPRFGVFKLVLDRIERQESDAIFAYGANDEGRTAFVECRKALLSVDLGDDSKRILGGGDADLLA